MTRQSLERLLRGDHRSRTTDHRPTTTGARLDAQSSRRSTDHAQRSFKPSRRCADRRRRQRCPEAFQTQHGPLTQTFGRLPNAILTDQNRDTMQCTVLLKHSPPRQQRLFSQELLTSRAGRHCTSTTLARVRRS